MKSKSKFELNPQKIKELFEKAAIPDAHNISPLGAGEYNAVYAVEAGGQSYALKIAPLDSTNSLVYEKNMMEQEVYYYGLMSGQTKIKTPEIYYSDFSRTLIPTDYFIMERLEGCQLDQADLTEEEKKEAEQKLCAMAAEMHSVKGEAFGYRQNGLHENWYKALLSMVENLIQDARNRGKGSRNGKKLLQAIHKHQDILKKVDSRLINFDIWPPNIFCHKSPEGLQLSWIDPERCLWGDRMADFVCLDFMNMSLEKKTDIIKAYNEASDYKVSGSAEENIRYALMLGYLGLIMEVEKYARYSLFHFGYWRNVSVCNMIFKNCFRQL